MRLARERFKRISPVCSPRRWATASSARARARIPWDHYGRYRGLGFHRVAKYVAATPYGLDIVFATGRLGEFLAQFADEDIDNLELGLVHPAIQVVQEHFLRQGRTLAQAEQLENTILLAGEMDRLVVDRHDAGIQIDNKLTGPDRRFGVALGTPHDRLNARDQFTTIKRLGQEVIGAEAETLELVVEFDKTREDQDRRAHA